MLFNLSDSLSEYGTSVLPMTNQRYLLAGNSVNSYALDSTLFYRVFIAVTDSHGNKLNHFFLGENYYNYGLSNHGNSMTPCKDGGYALACYKFDTSVIQRKGTALLVKISANAQIQWIKEYIGDWENTGAYKVLQLEDDGYMLLASTQRMSDYRMETLLIRTDSMGKQLWQKQYSSLPLYSNFDPYGFVQLPDKGFVITGATDYINYYFIQINRVDSTGNLIWSKKYGGNNSYADIKILQSGNLLIYGKSDWSSYLAELNLNGDTLYQVITPPSGRMDIYRVAFEKPDGLILVGNKYKDTPVQLGDHIVGWIQKRNKDHKALWQRTFYRHNLYDNNFLGQYQTPDKGLILVGASYDSTVTIGSADIWLVKTDSFGCDVPGCQLADGIAPLQPGQGASMQLYPNPAATQGPVHVQYLLRKPGQLTVTLTDINGKQLAEIPFYSHATEGSLSMDLSWLKPGIYTVTLKTETGLAHQKLLLQ